jgi:hypothetical protein
MASASRYPATFQSAFALGCRVLAEARLELPLPHDGGRIGIIADAAEDLEEMPVAFEVVVVIAVLGIQQIEGRPIVRLGLHLRAELFVHLETVAIVEMSTGPNSARMLCLFRF